MSLLLAGAPALAAGISTNWAGYVASPSPQVGSRFEGVSGSWRLPSVTCTPGHVTDSAVWVGLGGYSEGSHALEQVGTDADCTGSGRAVYSSWFELLPAAPVDLKLRVRPGDELSASVRVRHQRVTFSIQDLSSGEHFRTSRRVGAIDASSAEWIVEAPSVCPHGDECAILPLANFGQVSFSTATASVGGHSGPVTDPDWVAVALELQQTPRFAGFRRGAQAHRLPGRTVTMAAPSASAAPSGAFSVTWQQSSQQLAAASPPTLPGSGGGPP